MVVVLRQQDDAVADADPPRARGDVGEQDLRRGAVRVVAQVGVLDGPDAVEAGLLGEQGAQPLRALADLDEACMYLRRGARGDGARAGALLQAAVGQFEAIGMSGWIRRAEALRGALG